MFLYDAYRFIIERLLFRTSIANDTNTIFITCNGLNDTKIIIIHHDEYKTLGVTNLNEITNWSSVKESSIWVGVTFVNGNYPTEGSNFAFAFKSKNISDLTRFNLKLLDGKLQKKILRF